MEGSNSTLQFQFQEKSWNELSRYLHLWNNKTKLIFKNDDIVLTQFAYSATLPYSHEGTRVDPNGTVLHKVGCLQEQIVEYTSKYTSRKVLPIRKVFPQLSSSFPKESINQKKMKINKFIPFSRRALMKLL